MQPECLIALLAKRNQRLNAGPYGEGNASVHFVGVLKRVETGLPGAQHAASTRFLTFVQGHRQTTEHSLQAAAFALSRATALVSASDLLVHSNNPSMHASTLLRHIVRYPHRTMALLHTADNSFGYRCGHLHAVASTRFVWESYRRGVIFLHPDVYLLPRAVSACAGLDPSTSRMVTQRALRVCLLLTPRSPGWTPPSADWLSSALDSAAANATALLVTRLTPRHVRNANGTRQFKVAGGTFSTDLFAFLPHLLVSNTTSHAAAASAAATLSSSLSSATRGLNATRASGLPPLPSLQPPPLQPPPHPADVVWRDICIVPPREHVVWPERCLWRMGAPSASAFGTRLQA